MLKQGSQRSKFVQLQRGMSSHRPTRPNSAGRQWVSMSVLHFSRKSVSIHFTSPYRALKDSVTLIAGRFPAIDVVTYDGENVCTVDNRRATVHQLAKSPFILAHVHHAADAVPPDHTSRFQFCLAINIDVREQSAIRQMWMILDVYPRTWGGAAMDAVQ
jgi:hypothetical protein